MVSNIKLDIVFILNIYGKALKCKCYQKNNQSSQIVLKLILLDVAKNEKENKENISREIRNHGSFRAIKMMQISHMTQSDPSDSTASKTSFWVN